MCGERTGGAHEMSSTTTRGGGSVKAGSPDVVREVASLDMRARMLDEIVKEEVTGGARVDHRDTVSAVLAKGSARMLVTVDEGGTIHIDRLEGKRPRRR